MSLKLDEGEEIQIAFLSVTRTYDTFSLDRVPDISDIQLFG